MRIIITVPALAASHPGYPFVHVDACTTAADFESKLLTAATFNQASYIEVHNAEFRQRFHRCCSALGWVDQGDPARGALAS